MRYPLALLFVPAILCLTNGWTAADDDPASFRRDVAPILVSQCVACHTAKRAEGSYRLDTFELLTQAGDSELPPLTGNDLENSELYRRIIAEDEDERMPAEAEPLPAEQIALVRRWIESGAKSDAPDPRAALATILPSPVYPAAPERYSTTLPVTALTFSPSGGELIVAGYHELTVWNPQDGSLLRRIGGIAQRTYALAWSPDGKLLAAASGTPGRLGEVRLFSAENDKMVTTMGRSSDVVLDVAFDAEGSRLAAVGADGIIRILDVANGNIEREITSHSDWVTAVAWNGDGSLLATASRDKSAKVFSTADGEMRVTYSGHNQMVTGIGFHHDGKQVFSAGADRKIQVWNIKDGKKNAEMTGIGGEIYDLIAADGFLFVAAADKTARQFGLEDRKQVRSYGGHSDWVLSLAYDARGKRLATGCFDGEVRVWNAADGQQITRLIAAPGYSTENSP